MISLISLFSSIPQELTDDILIKSGNIELCREFQNQYCYTKIIEYNGTWEQAVQSNNLEKIKWLHQYKSDEYSSEIMDIAAGLGNLEILEWLHNNRSEGYTTRAIIQALKNGHLNIVKFILLNKSKDWWAMDINILLCLAEKYKQKEVVEWLNSNECKNIFVKIYSEQEEARNSWWTKISKKMSK
jgi:hypothetical protein